VGASLLAKAVGQLASVLDVLMPSRASPLPHWGCAEHNLKPLEITCGSARESGGSVCIYIECTDAFASRLAPTLGLCRTHNLKPLEITCGSLLAKAVG
jgi:hypothetical protein